MQASLIKPKFTKQITTKKSWEFEFQVQNEKEWITAQMAFATWPSAGFEAVQIAMTESKVIGILHTDKADTKQNTEEKIKNKLSQIKHCKDCMFTYDEIKTVNVEPFTISTMLKFDWLQEEVEEKEQKKPKKKC